MQHSLVLAHSAKRRWLFILKLIVTSASACPRCMVTMVTEYTFWLVAAICANAQLPLMFACISSVCTWVSTRPAVTTASQMLVWCGSSIQRLSSNLSFISTFFFDAKIKLKGTAVCSVVGNSLDSADVVESTLLRTAGFPSLSSCRFRFGNLSFSIQKLSRLIFVYSPQICIFRPEFRISVD